MGPEGRLQLALAQASVKLFVGGITGTTAEAMLFGHFGKYGEIVEAPVMRDKITKKPRGFAFVVFRKAASVEAALADAHEIDGRAVDVKRAVPRDEYGRPILSEVPTKKIFVGGLASTCTDADLISHFGEFGKIEDAVVMFDGASRRSRGFGFVTFSSESAVDRVLAKGSRQELHKKQVEIKKAIPKETTGGGATRAPGGRGPRGSGRKKGGPGRGGGGGFPNPAYGRGLGAGYQGPGFGVPPYLPPYPPSLPLGVVPPGVAFAPGAGVGPVPPGMVPGMVPAGMVPAGLAPLPYDAAGLAPAGAPDGLYRPEDLYAGGVPPLPFPAVLPPGVPIMMMPPPPGSPVRSPTVAAAPAKSVPAAANSPAEAAPAKAEPEAEE